MPEIIELDEVLVPAAAVQTWMRLVRKNAARLPACHRFLDPLAIPGERARIEDDGSLTIFLPLAEGDEISLPIAARQWEMCCEPASRRRPDRASAGVPRRETGRRHPL